MTHIKLISCQFVFFAFFFKITETVVGPRIEKLSGSWSRSGVGALFILELLFKWLQKPLKIKKKFYFLTEFFYIFQ